MQTNCLKEQGALRLQQLIRDLKFVAKQDLAKLIRKDPRTISYWYSNGLSLDNARLVAGNLGISPDYFMDDEHLFQANGPQFYLNQGRNLVVNEDRLIFDGRATLMLARFLETNAQALVQLRDVRVETYEGRTFNARGADIKSHVDGYQRSIILNETENVGGANAVLEEHRLKTIELIGTKDLEFLMPGGGLPCVGDGVLAAHAHDGLRFLQSMSKHSEVIHFCARLPNEQTFELFFEVLRDIKRNFELAEYAFDAVKRYEGYFLHHKTDAKRMQAFLRKYIKSNVKNPDAANAVTYAIEALPFCSYMDAEALRKCSFFLMEIQRRNKKFAYATGAMTLAAQAAAGFLPFVRNPKSFDRYGPA